MSLYLIISFGKPEPHLIIEWIFDKILWNSDYWLLSHFVLTRSQDTSSICNLCIFYVWGKNSIFLFTIIFLILHYLSQNFISVSRQKKMFFWVNNNVRSQDRDKIVKTRHHIIRIVPKVYFLLYFLSIRKVYSFIYSLQLFTIYYVIQG